MKSPLNMMPRVKLSEASPNLRSEANGPGSEEISQSHKVQMMSHMLIKMMIATKVKLVLTKEITESLSTRKETQASEETKIQTLIKMTHPKEVKARKQMEPNKWNKSKR